jgi:hypothetical protein
LRHRLSRLARPVALAAIFNAIGACATSQTPRVLHAPDPSVEPATHIDSIHQYEVAIASITRIFERDLEFPRYPVALHFYADHRAFEAGLLASGYDATLARNTARTMEAVGGYRRVLLNEAAFSRQPWPARVTSVAHELAHSLQYELGGGRRGTSDQWLREGFAEWLALQVSHRLRGLRFQEARRRYLEIVRRFDRTGAPALAEMVTFPQWVALSSRRGNVPYAHAFLAVDYLIERHGIPAVLEYFRRFATSWDRVGNFRATFGENLETFEAALLKRLRR